MNALSCHSGTAKAYTYLLKQWDALNEYCRNGWVELDNNLCENAHCVVALGRRNYIFFGWWQYSSDVLPNRKLQTQWHRAGSLAAPRDPGQPTA